MAAKQNDEQRDSGKRRRDRTEDDNRAGKRPARGPRPSAKTGSRRPSRKPRPDSADGSEWDGGPEAEDRRSRGPQLRPGARSNRRPRADFADKPERGRRLNTRDAAGSGSRTEPRAKTESGAGAGAEAGDRRPAAVVSAGRRVQTPALVKDGRDFLYGRHPVLEMLRAGRRRVHNIWLGEGVQQTGIVADILSTARLRGIPVKEMSRVGFERLGSVNHQGVVAEVEAYRYVRLDDLLTGELPEDALFLALDHLQDVQNLGTLLRTAEAMNVTGVILPERRAAEVTPAAVNASAGAVEHLQIAMVGNLVQALEQLKAAGVWIAGLDSGAGSMPLGRADLSGRIALVVGAEGEGLARLVREKCDWLVAIPMYGKIGSLNAAVAGSVVLVTARGAQRSRE